MLVSTALSRASTGCWLAALIPQQWHNFATKSVEGLSPYLLILWLLGDLCNLVGCILTSQLPFQTWLAAYFTLNDIFLNFQYWHYNRESRKRRSSDISLQESPIISESLGIVDTYSSTDSYSWIHNKHQVGKLSTIAITTATSTLLSVTPTTALPLTAFTKEAHQIPIDKVSISVDVHNIGLFFAWLCTLVYCSSRVPQLYHNYQRKSVDGISPLLFTFALLGNITYGFSIICSEAPQGLNYAQYITKEMPYLLGSVGTVVLDILYFLQREIYKSV